MESRTYRLDEINSGLGGVRYELQNEKMLQGKIERRLTALGMPYQREVRLSPDHIIDFMVGNVGIEIKIKKPGVSAKAIYSQCLSYCEYEQVGSLLLCTNQHVPLPPRLNEKPTLLLNLGLAWL